MRAARLRQQGGEAGGELAGVGDRLGAMRLVERRVDFGEIPDMRAMQDGGAELGGFDRILPAVPDQRAADENDRRQAIDETEFADGVGDINVGRRVGQLAARPQPSFQPGGPRDFGDADAALGMARHDQRQQAGKIRAQPPVRVDHGGFLAGMGGCRRDYRPAADRALQGRELGAVGRRRRPIELEIAGGDDMRGAQFAEPLGVGRRARQAEVEPAASGCRSSPANSASAGTSFPTAGR